MYKCSICGHIYNPEEGEPSLGIEPGSPFSELPSDFVCPICGAPKEEYFPYE
jgi:rubredoxin